MYAIKPVLTNQDIDLPTCMYKMSVINSSSIDNTQNSKNNSSSVSFHFTMQISHLKYSFLAY